VLLLRWSWRDLRARWLQVAAIALIIGIGSGTYSGLTSVSHWRRASFDASFQRQQMYDLRFTLADGSYVDAAALARTASVDGVDEAEPRLTERIQVDASTGDELVLVPGRLVGVDLSGGGPHVSTVEAQSGRDLDEADRDEDVALIDEKFADGHDLDVPTTVTINGNRELAAVGRALSPEQYFVVDDRGSFFSDFAVLYTSIETAGRLTGHPGEAAEVVVRIEPGADRDAVEQDVVAALADRFPDVGVTVTRQEDDQVLRLMYDDIEGDQRFYDIFAVLILAGAAFAAFNLTGRVVEAQRREIGIGMALGVPPARIAERPLLMGAEVALVGVVAGVGVGLVIDAFMGDLLRGFFPLPAWTTEFQPAVFLRGAVLGFVIPLVATAIPIRRAVRVAPVDAVRTGHRAATGGLAPLLRRIPLPGRSVAQLPVRNTLRAPRRTMLTALGIAAAITTLVGVVGMIDSFLATIDEGDEEILGDTPDRLVVDLDSFQPDTTDAVRGVLDDPTVGTAETGLALGGQLAPGTDDEIDVLISVIDFDSPLWTPTAAEGELRTDEPGLVIAQKAADDLDLSVGDAVPVRIPRREGLTGYRFVVEDLPVLAIHPNPYRFLAYVDIRHADLFRLDGITNTIRVAPAPGASVEDVQRALFARPGVAAVEPVSAIADAIRDELEEVLGVFAVIQAAVLLMALLIAFNSTAINMDERAREHATLMAFGLPSSRVMGVAVVESLIVGLIGTTVGVVAGRLLVEWITRVTIADTLPDIGVVPYVSLQTVLTAVVLGTVAVALAPLLTLRRLRRMDLPSTLRVVE